MTHEEITKLILDNGFDTGWVVSGGTLVQWQHDADPPAPLTRPEAQDDLAD